MPPFEGFIAGSYVDGVFQADAERSMNWLPSKIESPSGKTKTGWVLIPRPGLVRFAKLGSSTGVRAEFSVNNRAFGIGVNGARNTFYETKSDKSVVTYGNLAGDRRPQIAASETQLLILSGGLGYVFTFATSTLTQITDPDFPTGAVKCGFLNGFFLVLEPNSQVFAFSGINDGLSWNGLDFGDVEGAPGYIVTFIIDHLQIWFMGNNHAEAFANTGDALNPFQRIQSGFMEQGAAGVDAICNGDNTIFWLGKNAEGQGIVWRANGFTPQRVSTYAIEAMIADWGDLSQVSMYCYQETGHTYVRLDCPNANGGNGATVVYDVSSDYWHERGFWDATINDFRADLARTHMFCFGKHLVGDYRSGWIYEAKASYHSDAGAAIRRVRSSPDLANAGSWTVYKLFQLMIETGVALDGALPPPGALFQLHSYFFPSTATNHFANSGTSDLAPWQLCSINSQSSDGAVATNLSITADGVTYGPYTIAPGDTLLIYPPIAVTSGDTWMVSSTSVWLHFNASTGAGLSAFQASFADAGGPVTLLNRDAAAAEMTLRLGDFSTNAGGFAVAVPFPGPTSVTLDDGVTVTNAAPLATAPWADSLSVTAFTTPSEGSLEWISIAPVDDIPEGGAPAGDGTDPQLVLQVSNDGGKTWGNERKVSMGLIGEYNKLLEWRRCGRSRNRAFRVICSEPVYAALVACDIEGRAGS